MLILKSASKMILGISRGRSRPFCHLKACLRGFQKVPWAHILCEELKWENITTSKPASRPYDHFLNPRPLEATLVTSDLLDPNIWYSNDFPWPQDVKFDLGLGWPRAASSDLGIKKWSYSLEAGFEVVMIFNFSSSHKIWAQGTFWKILKQYYKQYL